MQQRNVQGDHCPPVSGVATISAHFVLTFAARLVDRIVTPVFLSQREFVLEDRESLEQAPTMVADRRVR